MAFLKTECENVLRSRFLKSRQRSWWWHQYGRFDVYDKGDGDGDDDIDDDNGDDDHLYVKAVWRLKPKQGPLAAQPRVKTIAVLAAVQCTMFMLISI